MRALDNFTRHYLIAALWAGVDDNCDPLDAHYDMSDIADATIEKARKDCAEFQRLAGPLLAQAYQFYIDSGKAAHPDAGSAEACAGHDFLLTRNRHGTGFWDRGMPDNLGQRLTSLCHDGRTFPEVSFYVGDDGRIYSE